MALVSVYALKNKCALSLNILNIKYKKTVQNMQKYQQKKGNYGKRKYKFPISIQPPGTNINSICRYWIIKLDVPSE